MYKKENASFLENEKSRGAQHETVFAQHNVLEINFSFASVVFRLTHENEFRHDIKSLSSSSLRMKVLLLEMEK